MSSFDVQIWYDERNACTLYSVLQDGLDTCEADRFIQRFIDKKEFDDDLNKLIAFIQNTIAGRHGAHRSFFRDEASAKALPPKRSRELSRLAVGLELEHPLRWYCYPVRKEVLILLNGGLKTKTELPHQDNPDLRGRFYDAQRFVRVIDQALQNREIQVHGRFLCDHLGEPITTLTLL